MFFIERVARCDENVKSPANLYAESSSTNIFIDLVQSLLILFMFTFMFPLLFIVCSSIFDNKSKEDPESVRSKFISRKYISPTHPVTKPLWAVVEPEIQRLSVDVGLFSDTGPSGAPTFQLSATPK